jgi:hypothetical protein
MATVSQKHKVEKVMDEYKKGKLKSGSGSKVKNRKQAVAIAMSESGQSRHRKKRAKPLHPEAMIGPSLTKPPGVTSQAQHRISIDSSVRRMV